MFSLCKDRRTITQSCTLFGEHLRGNKSKGTLYSGSNNADDVAWYSLNIKETCFGDFCFKSAQDVGTKAPNELGIYDMSGNVYEWMYDSYGTFSEGDLTNPTGPATLHTQKVRRGGSFDQPASESRVSARKIRSIEGKDGSIGIPEALATRQAFKPAPWPERISSSAPEEH
jgi:sulfatase modifying factor 1